MRRIFMMALVIAAVGLVSSCGSSKTAQSEVYETPCSGPGFRTEASHFRASASAIAGNEDVARKQATASARQELAAIINTTIKAVADNYAKNYVKGEEAEYFALYDPWGAYNDDYKTQNGFYEWRTVMVKWIDTLGQEHFIGERNIIYHRNKIKTIRVRLPQSKSLDAAEISTEE